MSFLGGALGGGGLAGGAIGKAVVTLELATAKYQAELKAAQAQTTTTTSKMGSALGGMGASVGLAAVAVGAVAVKMALDFEKAFTKIETLSNASAQDIERWKGEVLDLAGTTAQAPQELAEALFFLSSAGLKAADVMPALEQAARASAIGLGETADVANITASAMNAYAASGLTAVQVTDTLVAAVREGRAEPEEFAEALGRILPIASRAGVEFDEVTASLAGLSNIGLDVNEGVTAMRGLLTAIVAPGNQAAEALADLGISTEQLRQVLSEGGILAALQLLEDRSGGNIDTLRKIIPNVRALTGELGLMGENADNVAQVFDNVTSSTGAADEAMATWEASTGAKFEQMMVDLQVAAVRFGDALLPMAEKAVDAFSKSAEALEPLLKGLEALSALTPEATEDTDDFALSLNQIPGAVDPGPIFGIIDALSQYGDETETATANTESLRGQADQYVASLTAAVPATEEVVKVTKQLTEEEIKFREELRDTFTVTDDVWSALAAKSKVTANQIIADLNEQIEAQKDYARNWKEVAERAVTPAAEQVVQEITDMGMEGAGILAELASVNDKKFNQIIDKWAESGELTDAQTRKVDNFIAHFNNIPDGKTVTLNVQVLPNLSSGALAGWNPIIRDAILDELHRVNQA